MINLKVGDEVGFGKYHWGTLIRHGFSRVTKINHYGHVHLENGRQFDRYGDERKQTYGGVHLIAADRLRHELQALDRLRARNAAACELKALLDAQRNSRGDMCAVNNEVREKMIELVNNL